MANNKDDWEDVPVEQDNQVDDWQETNGVQSNIPSFLREAGETAQDFSIGTGSSLLMGAADEIGGALSAGLESGLSYIPGTSAYDTKQVDEQLAQQGFQVPEDTFGDKYRTYQQGSEQAFDVSAERSPYANILGQFAGGMTGGHIASSALGIGKAAAGTKTLAEIAKDSSMLKALGIGAGRGATEFVKTAPYMVPELVASSKNQLIGENANHMGVLEDVGTGLAFGLPLMMGMSATSAAGSKVAGKGAEVVEKVKGAFADENNPRLRQMAKAFTTYGQDIGIHPRSHGADIATGPEAFTLRDEKATNSVLGTLQETDAKLGQEVGDSLQQSTEIGRLVNISPDIESAAARLSQLSETIPELAQSRRSAAAYDKILNRETQLSPLELKTLIDDIDSSIGVFKSATNRTPQDSSTLSELIRFRSSISQSLKKEVPEYRFAAERFENFRNVLEQVVSRDRPVEVTNKFYGKLNDADNKLYGSIQDMIQHVQRDDAASQTSRTSFKKFMDALQTFETNDAQRIIDNPSAQKIAPDPKEIRSFMLNASDDSVLRGSARATTQGRSLVPDLKEAIIGKAPTSGAYWAGKIAKTIKTSPKIQTAAELSRAVMKAPDNYLLNLASRLDSIGMKSTGQALKESIETGNTYKKQAALFTILQNPSAKLYINTEDFQDEKEE
jgi:hypothetical protein